MNRNFNYGSDQLTSGIAISIAHHHSKGSLTSTVRQKISQSHQHVQDIVSQERSVYGITTGFGALANTRISEEDTRTLQYKILQSHSVGVGEPVPQEIAMLMMITKVH